MRDPGIQPTGDPGGASSIIQLQELILDTRTVNDFLDELAGLAASTVCSAVGHSVDCSVTLRRPERPLTVGGNCSEARAVDHAELDLGGGPCLTAMDTHEPVVLEDAHNNNPWPQLEEALERNGYESVLGVPMVLDDGADAALNFMAPEPQAFDSVAVDAAEDFAKVASDALRISVRIATEQLLAENLRVAMASRTTIDMACGALMAQHRCSAETAFAILARACTDRNGKLHAVARDILGDLTGHGGQTLFDN
ncbi:GAF and ANTAR domain-containing protein [Arthrobacter sp. M4]|uniref:GAF and ANTAR domain-containing protein n=1 Tax=Arthrobacter sp. M4 TaxID=218160 RepID=UPI001CDBB5B5|nr:GAF and ANTAR domain-containing protein [Arthrobacter sp. M4]MCA4135192.1 GAF and ANTAR domain-containing protein [Arthrobacter sp. M4]